MNNKLFFYENSFNSNFSYIKNFIIHMSNKFNEYKNDNYSISSITKLMYEEEDNQIEYIKSLTPLLYINIAFMKRIIKIWLDNLTNYNQYIINTIDSYYNNYDILIFYNDENDYNKILYDTIDGDKSCDISINLILIHLIIKHILIFISDNYNNYKNICFKILKNFRIGLFQYYNNIIPNNYDKLFFKNYEKEEYLLYIFFIELKNEYNITCFNNNSNIIKDEIKLYIPWILNCILTILIDNNSILPFLFIPTLLNNIDSSNLYEIIENDYNFYLIDIKKFKDVIYKLNLLNKCPNSNINITKRIKFKDRKIRNLHNK